MELAYEILEAYRKGRNVIKLRGLDRKGIGELWKEMRRLKEKGIVKTWKYRKSFKIIMLIFFLLLSCILIMLRESNELKLYSSFPRIGFRKELISKCLPKPDR